MKVVILGRGDMLSNLIEGTLDAGCEIAGVFRYERTQYHRLLLAFKDFFKSSHEVTIIKQHKLREIICRCANSEKFKKEILRLNADVILVGSWGEKLKKEIIDLPTIACVNVHPSFLPKYRGPNPYMRTIMNGETTTGITFHLMDEKFDSGAILSQKKIDILPNETSKELKERVVFQARLMCCELLKKLEYGLIIPVYQNESEASYFPNIQSEDMMLDFERESASQINARIRALHPWLPAYVTYMDKFFIPNPYRMKILSKKQCANVIKINGLNNVSAGDIINCNAKIASITVMCLNGEALRMDDVKLYGFFNKPLTKLFIKKITTRRKFSRL